jgi:hypothetical protein
MRTKLIATAVAGAALAGSIATGVGLAGANAGTNATAAKLTATSCKRTVEPIRVVSLNVKSNPLMSAGKVRADVDKAAKLGADVIMWQEIQPDYYKNIVRSENSTGGNGRWKHYFTGYAIPISIRVAGDSPWVVKDTGVRKMHNGMAKVSPHRYVTWLKVYNKQSRQTTILMNTHMVSGAWNGRYNRADDWRKKMWNIHFAKQSELIKDFSNRGYTVVYGGDFNRMEMGKFTARDSRITVHGIDKIGVVRTANDRIEKVTVRKTVGGFNSDHDAKRVSVRVSGCAAS